MAKVFYLETKCRVKSGDQIENMIQLPNLLENSFLKCNPLLVILPLLPLIGNAHL